MICAAHRFTEYDDWFQIETVAPGVRRITERYYAADMRCNIYLIYGRDRDLIVDTGLGLASLKSALAGLTRSPLLVLSHAHYDHIGGAFEFPERLMHPAEAGILSQPTGDKTYSDLLLKTDDFSRLPWPKFEAQHWTAHPASATGMINESDIIDLGGPKFEVLSTPGHSWGSICLWEERTGTLFCADTVYDGELFDFLPCSDVPTYVRTLKRLREYPVEQAFPGHGPVLNGDEFRAVIDRYLESRT